MRARLGWTWAVSFWLLSVREVAGWLCAGEDGAGTWEFGSLPAGSRVLGNLEFGDWELLSSLGRSFRLTKQPRTAPCRLVRSGFSKASMPGNDCRKRGSRRSDGRPPARGASWGCSGAGGGSSIEGSRVRGCKDGIRVRERVRLGRELMRIACVRWGGRWDWG